MDDDNTTGPDHAPVVDGIAGLSPEHVAYLKAQAIDTDLAQALGVRSLLSHDDNPQTGVWPNWANHPAILFPWTNEAGDVQYQVRPDNPTASASASGGRPRKYVFQKGMVPVLWAVRPVDGATKILIVEGTKQCLAAATYAPAGVAVYGMAGIRMWQHNGMAIDDLTVAEGREVIVIPDSDAAENPEVYKGAVELGEALKTEDAKKVSFVRVPGGGTSGLDDVLAATAEAKRAPLLARLIKQAAAKPATAAPKAKRKGSEAPADPKRKTIIVNRDRFEVINDLTAALLDRWNARELFNHGGALSRRKADGMHPIDKGTFNDLVQETAITVTENEGANGTTYGYGWPDPNTMASTLSRADQFAKLNRISHAPFVRPDGTVVTEPGYDDATQTMLIPDPIFEGIEVPESPTAAQVLAARELILTEWLGDFPFEGEVDRANALALIVTPAIRGMVPKVPLAVIDGLQMGVGKNLIADCLTTVYTGTAAEPMNWVSEPDELRKQITAAFRTGAEFFIFDEAHTLEGAPLAQALTASTWQDRILGVSTMANFPNTITWLSLGNQVHVKGDITRRVYRIALRPTYDNPQDRDSSSFRHPGQSGLDLASWTRANRRELMVAILTLVRAWFAAGSPRPARGISFGSFEVWERITGGIVEAAGMTNFLDNIKTWRSESDFDSQYWLGHLTWLRDQFGAKGFKTADVKGKALTDPAGYQAPPKLDDAGEKGYTKALGEAYSRLRGRRYEGLWLERDGVAHGHVSLWRVFASGDAPDKPSDNGPDKPSDNGPDPVDEPVDNPENEHAEARGPAPEDTDGEGHDEVRGPTIDNALSTSVLTFDLETGDAEDLYRVPGDQYVRIGATAADDLPVIAYDEATAWNVTNDVIRTMQRGGTVTGHDIMAFDLPALVRSGQMTMLDVHEMAAEGRLFDGLLAGRFLDPPMARDKGVDVKRKYDLGFLGEKYGLGEKLSDVSKPLAAKYGGWAGIPIDVRDPDPERAADAADFQRYMVQDVELSRKLHGVLSAEVDERGLSAWSYLQREHRVAAIAAQISINGFLVDQGLLATRVASVNRTKAAAIGWLTKRYQLPTHDPKGKVYSSPLASKAGKEIIGAALIKAGVPEKVLWRTGVSKDIQLSTDAMRHYAREYHHSGEVRAIATAVSAVVGARSVYQTALDHLCPDGRVHPKVSFEQATGRWSVTRPGMTVFGKRAGKHVERAIFLPDPGEVLISIDLSQVDMRAVAGLSQDQAYINMLRTNDPHTDLAVALFGDAGKREVAKAIGHGWNYGESLQRISNENSIEPDLVMKFDASMRERFGRLVEWREEVRAIATAGHLLDNGFGRMMRADPQRAHTQAPALSGQGAARDIMMAGLLRLPGEILPMLRVQVHDEVVASVPLDRADEIATEIIAAMSFEWKGVPILADRSPSGTNWSRCYEK